MHMTIHNLTQLHKDLQYVFESFSLDCLYHLRSNRHRLIRRKYFDQNGNGCLMYLLSETLPESLRIRSKETLIRYFSDGDENASVYQPPKWIVRVWDERICSSVVNRYGESPTLNADEIFELLDEFIAEKETELESNLSPECKQPDETQNLLLV